MKYLVLGGNGLLGSEFVRQLPPGSTVAVDVDKVNITILTEIQALVCNVKPDIIFNCAGYTQVDQCESNSDIAFAVNAIGARNVAIAADSVAAKLMYPSSDYVFDGDSKSQYIEFSKPNPQNIYGHSKLAGEKFTKEHCKRHFVIRTAWLYGYHGNSFVKTILKAARQEKPLKVVIDQIGNPTNASDLVRQLMTLAGTSEYGIYHCTSNGECSWHEFACEFLRLSGLGNAIEPCSTDEFPRPAKRPAHSSLDNMMLRLTIGDHMPFWKDSLAEFMERYDKGSGEFSL